MEKNIIGGFLLPVMSRFSMRYIKKLIVRLLPTRLLWLFGSQTVEHHFHISNAYRQSDSFMGETLELFTSWGYSPDDFADSFVVDLGAGSKLRSKFFAKATIIAIEPLADRFLSNIAWCDLNDAYQVYSQPAEKPIPDLNGTIQFVMCINVLDHVYDFREILHNVWNMLVCGGEFLLSVDLHSQPSLTHPIALERSTLLQSLEEIGFRVKREYVHLPTDTVSYGEGESYTVILEK